MAFPLARTPAGNTTAYRRNRHQPATLSAQYIDLMPTPSEKVLYVELKNPTTAQGGERPRVFFRCPFLGYSTVAHHAGTAEFTFTNIPTARYNPLRRLSCSNRLHWLAGIVTPYFHHRYTLTLVFLEEA